MVWCIYCNERFLYLSKHVRTEHHQSCIYRLEKCYYKRRHPYGKWFISKVDGSIKYNIERADILGDFFRRKEFVEDKYKFEFDDNSKLIYNSSNMIMPICKIVSSYITSKDWYI